MFKKMQKILAITLMLIMLLSVTCYAEDAIEVPVEETPESSEETQLLIAPAPSEEAKDSEAVEEEAHDYTQEETTGTTEEEEMLSDDLYLADTTIDYTRIVDGNAYIIGNDVTFGSVIGGDVFIIGNNVSVSKDAFIYGNLYVLANTFKLDGYVYGGDLYAACSEFTISDAAIVNRDVRVAANKLTFNGSVGRNVYASGNQVSVNDPAQIYGDFNYSSPSAIQIPTSAVQGKINYDESKVEAENSSPIISYIFSLVQFVVLVLAIFGVMILIAHKFLKKLENFEAKRVLPSIGFGLIGLIVTIPVAILLLMSVVATSVAFAIISAWCLIVFIISTPIAVISLAGLLAKKVNALCKAHNILAVIIVSILAWAIKLIPYIGGIITLLLVVYGLGLLITTVWKSRKEE